ncbi:MAG: methionine gamma-lyase family protein, partial [Clostridia bacterium]|nr:methionine gamma-lyase family protein [Clostridia bacterium]
MRTIEELILQAEQELKDTFVRIEENEASRTRQILDAFRNEGVSYRHFSPSTGYGYED